jgi:hypothetical protein
MSSITPMVSISDGRQCVGSMLARGRASAAAIHELTGSEPADT